MQGVLTLKIAFYLFIIKRSIQLSLMIMITRIKNLIIEFHFINKQIVDIALYRRTPYRCLKLCTWSHFLHVPPFFFLTPRAHFRHSKTIWIFYVKLFNFDLPENILSDSATCFLYFFCFLSCNQTRFAAEKSTDVHICCTPNKQMIE